MNENIFRTGPPAWRFVPLTVQTAPESRGHRRAAVNFRRPQAGRPRLPAPVLSLREITLAFRNAILIASGRTVCAAAHHDCPARPGHACQGGCALGSLVGAG